MYVLRYHAQSKGLNRLIQDPEPRCCAVEELLVAPAQHASEHRPFGEVRVWEG